jgi:hypothetical protein
MRRVYLRGRHNVLKRVLIHVGALNLSLAMRKWLGKGTPRGWQGYSADVVLAFLRCWMASLAHSGPEMIDKTRYLSVGAVCLEIFVPPVAA